MAWAYVLGPLLALAVLIVGWLFVPAPIKLLLSALVKFLPWFLKAAAPREYTPEEKTKIKSGHSPFSKRDER